MTEIIEAEMEMKRKTQNQASGDKKNKRSHERRVMLQFDEESVAQGLVLFINNPARPARQGSSIFVFSGSRPRVWLLSLKKEVSGPV